MKDSIIWTFAVLLFSLLSTTGCSHCRRCGPPGVRLTRGERNNFDPNQFRRNEDFDFHNPQDPFGNFIPGVNPGNNFAINPGTGPTQGNPGTDPSIFDNANGFNQGNTPGVFNPGNSGRQAINDRDNGAPQPVTNNGTGSGIGNDLFDTTAAPSIRNYSEGRHPVESYK